MFNKNHFIQLALGPEHLIKALQQLLIYYLSITYPHQ